MSGGSDRVIGDWLNFAPAPEVEQVLAFLPTLVDDTWIGSYRCELAVLRPTNTRAIFIAADLICVVVHAHEYPGFVQVIYIGSPGPPWTWG